MNNSHEAPVAAPSMAGPIPRLAPGIEIHHGPSGAMRLRSSPFPRRGLHRWFARLVRLPECIELELDDLGAWVVERFDGRDVGLLADDLAGHLKLTRREAEVALGDFLRQLNSRHLIRFEHPPSGEGA